ncbi:hypothetical protein DXT76_14810 [Halobacillus trueperi]|uniref:Uncharacterized protein n=1 Tax=Halobacillus trueperi TaxID=156205 RepID=A0A3D8VLF8_9BACI|nr:hypothetical protein DXT76_14810 [Halobacillus trueperi]
MHFHGKRAASQPPLISNMENEPLLSRNGVFHDLELFLQEIGEGVMGMDRKSRWEVPSTFQGMFLT